MMPKAVFCIVLVSLAVAHGGTISNELTVNRERIDVEGRIIEVPIIGGLILLLSKPLKVIWYLVSTAWSLVGYKMAAVCLAINAGIWMIQNSFSAILGAVAVLGFCKITGKCSLDYTTHRLVKFGEDLVYAARDLDNGISKFGEESY